MPGENRLRIEATFELTDAGRLFCVRYVPTAVPVRACVIFVHGFAEELNKSRHVVAATARALAGNGVVVEMMDLPGCGDSEGDLAGATVALWQQALAGRFESLAQRFSAPMYLWGLRFGALLAASCVARGVVVSAAGLVLWQPVTRGRQVITEFLRLRTAAALIAGGENRETVDDLRARLRDGEILEIAGYSLPPDLVHGMEALVLKELPPVSCPTRWLDVSRNPDADASPAVTALMSAWQDQGVDVALSRVEGPAFWSAGELEDCPALAPATVTALAEVAS